MTRKREKRTCKNCEVSFAIEEEDFKFYEKINVPPPTWCPECRTRRRYSWRNDRNLYRRKCGLCEKSIVTMYSSNKPFEVYCPNCWWGDGWDAMDHGRDYDFNRSFFDQFKELQLKVPRIALLGKNSVNSEYTNHSSDNKNCFMCSSAMNCEDVLYCDFIFSSSNTVDCSVTYEKAERCYECIDTSKCYQCQYSMRISDCSNCRYCYDCRGCTDCFLSTNLRNKNYCFLNEQYDKETYNRKVEEFNLASYADRQKLYKKYCELLETTALREYASIEQSVNSTGDYIFNSKNAVQCFDIDKGEDIKYCMSTIELKDAMDSYRNAIKMELIYECHALIRDYDTFFCNLSYDDSHIQYCDHCFNCQNLFGCIGLKKAEYCILNKRYSPDEYASLKEKIIDQMRSREEYGEFFPVWLSPFGYNESHASLYFKPLTKEEIEKRGWNWEDNTPGTFGKETVQSEEIPDLIGDVQESILEEVLKCVSCERNYNIVRPEFDFYKQETIPIPRLCPSCRDMRRIELRTPRRLWKRNCMCDYQIRKNSTIHSHHPEGKCPNDFQTAYASNRKEVVYCKECYQREMI